MKEKEQCIGVVKESRTQVHRTRVLPGGTGGSLLKMTGTGKNSSSTADKRYG